MDALAERFLDEVGRLDAAAWRRVAAVHHDSLGWDAAWDLAVRYDGGESEAGMRAAAGAGAPLGLQALAGAAAVAVAARHRLPRPVFGILYEPFSTVLPLEVRLSA